MNATAPILVSKEDATLLHALIARAHHLPRLDQAVDELASTLDGAQIVDATRLPPAVVSLGATVEYAELPGGQRRTVVLVHPIQADAGSGRVSVLSPVGRALLGRRRGDAIDLALPSGATRRIAIEAVRPVDAEPPLDPGPRAA